MSAFERSVYRPRVSVNIILLIGLLVTIWIAGGAARADVLGQVVVRAAAWIAIVGAVLFGARPSISNIRPALYLLAATLVLVLVQLVPLPPALWQMLPGRSVFVDIATVTGQPVPWRPLAIVPGATMNAAASLVVPFAVLVLIAGLKEYELAWLPATVLSLILAGAIIGLLQFSGVGFDNPFVNDSPGQVSGNMANRNHFSLLLALGCLVAPVWLFHGGAWKGWRAPVAGGLVLLFVLILLASGSRAGLIVGILAVAVGLLLVRQGLARDRRRMPGWVFPAIVAGSVLTLALFVALSIGADRAISIDRLFQTGMGEDLRTRYRPAVLAMIGTYFPAGSGYGGFDAVFRLQESMNMLKLTYFNHAHNDFLEVLLDGGLPALILLLAALCWWIVASIRAWRSGSDIAKLGSAMLGLIFVAEAFDYAARTPMMMTMIVIAAIWLGLPRDATARTPLPTAGG